jgi:hypothetical protein
MWKRVEVRRTSRWAAVALEPKIDLDMIRKPYPIF